MRLRFDTKEEAIAFADGNGVSYDLEEPPTVKPTKPKAYADNFKYNRVENWTH